MFVGTAQFVNILPPFSFIRDFGKQNTRGNVSKISLSRLERFENDAFWKHCFLLWTVKTMLSENADVIQIDTTPHQPTQPWVSKMADRWSHVASLLIGMISSLLTVLRHFDWNNLDFYNSFIIAWSCTSREKVAMKKDYPGNLGTEEVRWK